MMRRLLSSTALALVLMHSAAAGAVIPVTDGASITLQAASWARQAADMLQQIAQLKEMLTLQYAASLVLGPDAGAGWGDLIRAGQDLYSSAMNAYTGVMGVPGQIDGQIAVFMPPPGGWTAASLPTLMQRAGQMQRLLSNTSAQTMAMQSQLIAQQAKIAQQSVQTREQVLAAQGSMQATQAAGIALVGIQGQIQGLQQTTSAIADLAAAKTAAEVAGVEAVKAMGEADEAAMSRNASAGRPPQLDWLKF